MVGEKEVNKEAKGRLTPNSAPVAKRCLRDAPGGISIKYIAKGFSIFSFLSEALELVGVEYIQIGLFERFRKVEG
jgi:hypothetical protein